MSELERAGVNGFRVWKRRRVLKWSEIYSQVGSSKLANLRCDLPRAACFLIGLPIRVRSKRALLFKTVLSTSSLELNGQRMGSKFSVKAALDVEALHF